MRAWVRKTPARSFGQELSRRGNDLCNHSCNSRSFPAPLPACRAAACPVMLFLIPPGSEVAPPRVEGVRPCERAPLRWSSMRSENICCSVQHYSVKARISITMQIRSTQVLCTAGDSLLGWSLASSCLCWAWSAKIWAKLSMEFIFFPFFFLWVVLLLLF